MNIIPWMNKKDIMAIENIILKMKGPISVLEWGSGGSTKYFTEFMEKINKAFSWISIEYNKAWFDRVVGEKIKNTKIFLFDVGNDKLKQRNTNMDEYVDFPLSLNTKFDIIFVDGRKRRRCLINCVNLMKKDGNVLLHDAQRKYYHCAFKHFTSGIFLTKTLWLGNI